MTLSIVLDSVELDVATGSTVELNDSWSPYVQASFMVATPAAIPDPLTSPPPRVLITADDGATSRTFDLQVQRVRVQDDGLTRLEACSDEIVLQSYKRVAATIYTPETTSLRTLVQATLDEVSPGATLSDGPDVTIDPTASTWEPGKSAHAFLNVHVQRAGFRLWCDEDRVWHMDEYPLLLSGEVRVEYDADTMLSWSTDFSRDEWYDAVVLTYRWTDALGDSYVAYDFASSPGFSSVYSEDRPDTPFPGVGAAASILRRMRARGRSLPTSAISDYAATPGMSVIVDTPDTAESAGWLASVQWNDQGAMNLTTREAFSLPEMAWLLDPAGVSWLDVPAGVDWSEDT